MYSKKQRKAHKRGQKVRMGRGREIPASGDTFEPTRQERALGAELKFIDSVIVGAAMAVAGTIITNGTDQTLNGIPQGATDSDRVGNLVLAEELEVRWTVETLAAATAADTCRVIYYLDHQCNGAAAAGADILAETTVRGFRNMEKLERFTILKDLYFVINNQNSTSTTEKSGKFKVRLNVPIRFTGAAGTIGGITENNINCLVFSDTANPQFSHTTRVLYRDA